MNEDTSTPASGVNSVVMHDDYIQAIWDGAQDVTKVRQTNIETLKWAEVIRAQGKPILLSLEVINHPLMPNMAAFKEVMKVFRAISFDKVVICGTVSPMLMSLITTVMSSFKKEIQINYIADPEAALAWLRSTP